MILISALNWPFAAKPMLFISTRVCRIDSEHAYSFSFRLSFSKELAPTSTSNFAFESLASINKMSPFLGGFENAIDIRISASECEVEWVLKDSALRLSSGMIFYFFIFSSFLIVLGFMIDKIELFI